MELKGARAGRSFGTRTGTSTVLERLLAVSDWLIMTSSSEKKFKKGLSKVSFVRALDGSNFAASCLNSPDARFGDPWRVAWRESVLQHEICKHTKSLK